MPSMSSSVFPTISAHTPSFSLLQFDTQNPFDASLMQSSYRADMAARTQVRSNDATLNLAPIHENNTVSLKIGIVLLDEAAERTIFSCPIAGCRNSMRTFARLPDLRRHYTEQHASSRPAFWCTIPGCPRSEAIGRDPFRRIEKRDEHVRRQHNV